MRLSSPLGCLALLAALGLPPAPVQAQNCGAGCGPLLDNGSVKRSGDCGLWGMKQYPLSELRYIKQFCGPHVVPGSCFGYFKPQITPWGQACPLYGDAVSDALNSGPRQFATAPTTNSTPLTTPKPVETPKAAEVPKAVEAPKELPKTSDGVVPPKAPVVPPKPPTAPSKLDPGAFLPPLPEVSVPTLPPIPETPRPVSAPMPAPVRY